MKNINAIFHFSFFLIPHIQPISEFYRLYLQNTSRMKASLTTPSAPSLVPLPPNVCFQHASLLLFLSPSSSFSTQKSWLNMNPSNNISVLQHSCATTCPMVPIGLRIKTKILPMFYMTLHIHSHTSF